MILRFDPRTKIICLALVIISTLFIPSLEWEGIVIAFICLFGCLCGRVKRSLFWGAIYLLSYILWLVTSKNVISISSVSLVAWLGLVFKLFPSCIMAGIITKSTQINEFLSAMHKARISQNIVIPIAVLLRYLPTVKEDWRYIRDAMALREVSPSLSSFIKNPATTVECLYVPLLITASKTADELTIASVTRGIENPKERSSIRLLKFRVYDYFAILLFLFLTVMSILLQKGVL